MFEIGIHQDESNGAVWGKREPVQQCAQVNLSPNYPLQNEELQVTIDEDIGLGVSWNFCYFCCAYFCYLTIYGGHINILCIWQLDAFGIHMNLQL